jgi:hypothetical protein
MKPEGQTPANIEQISINNMVNVEALLDVLISAGIITEQAFFDAKRRIEQQIIDAQKQVSGGPRAAQDGPAQGSPIDPRLGRFGRK